MRHGTGHSTHSPIKQDAPAWSWRSHGNPSYTRSADAARYVAQCRQRELDKARQREETALKLLTQGWIIFKPVKAAYSPVIAKLDAHQSIRRETVTRLQERGLLVDHGKLAYRLAQRTEAPVPTRTALELLAPAVALLPAKVA